MLPNPAHPAVVHFPIVLMFLAPIFAAVSIFVIRRGGHPRRSWIATLLLVAALAGSAWVAVATGEAQEDRVEEVVSERVLHEHEENAEPFLLLSGGLLLVALVGLAPGSAGRAARAFTLVGAIIVAGAGVRVGHSGGELVYRHGAASAYIEAAAAPASAIDAGDDGSPDDGRRATDDDDDDHAPRRRR